MEISNVTCMCKLQKKPTVTAVLKHLLTGKASNLNINVGMRNDDRLQKCEGSYFKQTFADIDYAFFGYDILRGYPLEKGLDPGFTFPLFKTNYDKGRQTSDCRYKVPNGVVVVPDESCVTSFPPQQFRISTNYQKLYLCLLLQVIRVWLALVPVSIWILQKSSSKFSKSVSTETITVGAPPPANGDAMTWASTVKKVLYLWVINYDLSSTFYRRIHENLNVDHTHIANELRRMSSEYCRYLKRLGKLES
ncbi:unnamed protein product [Mytilus edulis]|uniref:Uncharacterized protein n=1 Tax=Mytilus edulis TaxID=6550 RepID=A0A8S3SMC1_MYTED|nr:unnamed protein product [Mytilus edulis]